MYNEYRCILCGMPDDQDELMPIDTPDGEKLLCVNHCFYKVIKEMYDVEDTFDLDHDVQLEVQSSESIGDETEYVFVDTATGAQAVLMSDQSEWHDFASFDFDAPFDDDIEDEWN